MTMRKKKESQNFVIKLLKMKIQKERFVIAIQLAKKKNITRLFQRQMS